MKTSQQRNKRPVIRCSSVLLMGAGVVILSGCAAVGPDYHPPQPVMPQSWYGRDISTTATTQASAPDASTTPATVMTSQVAELGQWWKNFNDPVLDELIQRSAEGNLDLLVAQSRIRQARAQRSVAGAGLGPGASADGSYRRSGTAHTSGDLYQVGLDATWELDIFGGVRRGIEAADANWLASIENRRDVLVTLMAEVALNYVQLRGLQQELVIAQDNLSTQLQTADLTRRLLGGGLASTLDVANANAQVASIQSQIPTLKTSLRQTIYNLSVLLGREPAALVDELTPVGAIPGTPPVVPVGLPSDLLRRRADIRMAEARIHAATAQIGVATADLFPRFSLTGSFGYQSNQLGSLLNSGNNIWSIGPGASWNIFSSGKIQSNIELQKAMQEESMLSYQKTVLTALQEVENVLVAYEQEQQRYQALAVAVEENQKAVNIAMQLYQQGLTPFLDVLTAQRSLYASQDALVRSAQTITTNLISLYKALGGGWEQEPVPTTQPVQPATDADDDAP